MQAPPSLARAVAQSRWCLEPLGRRAAPRNHLRCRLEAISGTGTHGLDGGQEGPLPPAGTQAGGRGSGWTGPLMPSFLPSLVPPPAFATFPPAGSPRRDRAADGSLGNPRSHPTSQESSRSRAGAHSPATRLPNRRLSLGAFPGAGRGPCLQFKCGLIYGRVLAPPKSLGLGLALPSSRASARRRN